MDIGGDLAAPRSKKQSQLDCFALRGRRGRPGRVTA
jgi:hypothetical protein